MKRIIWRREFIQIRNGAKQIMVGRPRKIGKRQPNGQLARVYINPREQVASQPHRRNVAKKFRQWPEAGSAFGRLMIRGTITPAQYEAGIMFTELVAAFCAVYDIPSPHPHGIDLSRVGVSRGQEMPPHVAEAIKRRYNDAFDACSEAGNKAQRAVKDHAVRDVPVGDFETLALLKKGLDKLVVHFALDPRKQIRDSRI